MTQFSTATKLSKHTAMLLSSVARVAQPVERGRSRARARCLSSCRSVYICRDMSRSATAHTVHSSTGGNGLDIKLKAQHIQSMLACRQVCAAAQDSPVEVTDEAESGWGKTTSQLVSLSTVAFAFLLLPQVTQSSRLHSDLYHCHCLLCKVKLFNA